MPIIPAPLRVTPAAGSFLFGEGATVAYRGAALAPLAGRFCEDVARRCGIRVRAQRASTAHAAGAVTVGLGGDRRLAGLPAPAGADPTGSPADERYALTIGEAGITLRAAQPPGAARGLASLLQLIATAAPGPGGAAPLPALRILDAPRFAWRGLSLDVVRRFFGPGQIRKVIDLLALYKLSVLHLHLTDDQGWRIEAGRPGARPRARRHLLHRRGAARPRQLRRAAFRHPAARSRHAGSRGRAAAAPPRTRQRAQPGQLRTHARPAAPHRLARPPAAGHLRRAG